MNILFITQLLPYPPVTGGMTKTYKILELLSRSHSIWVATFHDSLQKKKDIIELERTTHVHVKSFYRPETTMSSRNMLPMAFRSLFSLSPFRVLKYFDERMVEHIRTVSKRIKFDVIYIDHDTSYQYLAYVNSRNDYLKIYDEHNIDSIAVWRNVFEPRRKPLTRIFCIWDAAKYWMLERNICKGVDKIASISSVDRNSLINRGGDPKKITLLPLPFEMKNLFSFGSKTILFVGLMSWAPNKFGFQWFYTKVYPLIRKKIVGVRLLVVGGGVEADLRRFIGSDSSVCFTGVVDDVDDYYRKAGVVVVPIHVGGGIRIKLLEALAAGMPVVTTSLGAEGIISIIDDSPPAILADDAKLFAQSVVDYLSDKEIAGIYSRRGINFVRRHNSERYTVDALRKLLML